MSVFDIKQDGKYLIVDGEKALKKDIVVEMIDYGDNFFDVHFLNIKTDSLFGDGALCGICGRVKAKKYLEEFSKEANVPNRITEHEDEFDF